MKGINKLEIDFNVEYNDEFIKQGYYLDINYVLQCLNKMEN